MFSHNAFSFFFKYIVERKPITNFFEDDLNDAKVFLTAYNNLPFDLIDLSKRFSNFSENVSCINLLI